MVQRNDNGWQVGYGKYTHKVSWNRQADTAKYMHSDCHHGDCLTRNSSWWLSWKMSEVVVVTVSVAMKQSSWQPFLVYDCNICMSYDKIFTLPMFRNPHTASFLPVDLLGTPETMWYTWHCIKNGENLSKVMAAEVGGLCNLFWYPFMK